MRLSGRGRPMVDLRGSAFGKLLAIEPANYKYKGYNVWLCRCECGCEIHASVDQLRTLRHCGCLGIGRHGEPSPGQHGVNATRCSTPALPKGAAAHRSLFSRYKHQAKSRGIEWSIDLALFISMTSLPCAYCGDPPSQRANYRDGSILYSGIDRMDPSLGYDLTNCVPCCGKCNISKASMSSAEFRSWINKVHSYMSTNY